MAIIYSYPSTQPELTDLLIGTDVGAENATKSFTIQSIVSLVSAASGSGTVTSVDISGGTYLSSTGGPITDSGTITLGLSASGTPSSTTFLRGDNQWATPTANSGISVLSGGTTLTTALSSLIFTGNGVTGTDDGINNITITIPGSGDVVEAITVGNGLSVDPSTGIGTVNLENTGVLQITPGSGISLSPTGGTGVVEITATGTGAGSVTSVTPSSGLALNSGAVNTDPTIGIDLTGNNNYIAVSESQATAISTDFIPFNRISDANVKTTTFSQIPIDAVDAIKTYIDAGDTDDITNTFDNSASGFAGSVAPVQQLVTLTAAQYAALSPKNANFLYLTTAGAATQYTKTLAIDTSGVTGMSNATLGGDLVGATLTGVDGASYAFNTTISPNTGFYFSSGPSISNASGTFSSSSTVTTTITGTVEAVVVNTVVATLAVNGSLGSDNTGGFGIIWEYDTSGGKSIPGATQSGTNSVSYNFTVAAKFKAPYDTNGQYAWVGGVAPSVTISGTLTSSQTVTASLNGVYQAVGASVLIKNNIAAITGSATAITDYTVNNISTLGSVGGASLNGQDIERTITGLNIGDTITTVTSAGSVTNTALTPSTFSMGANQSFTVTQASGDVITFTAPSTNITSATGSSTCTVDTSQITVNGTNILPGTGYTIQIAYTLNGGAGSPISINQTTATTGPQNVGTAVVWSVTVALENANYAFNVAPANNFTPANSFTITAGTNQATQDQPTATVVSSSNLAIGFGNPTNVGYGGDACALLREPAAYAFFGTATQGAPQNPNLPSVNDYVYSSNNADPASNSVLTGGNYLIQMSASSQKHLMVINGSGVIVGFYNCP